MLINHTPQYAKAFARYLRKGIPLDIGMKAVAQEYFTPQYIWRTSDDNKVRSSHAANNGRVFSWDVRPYTGHPGEDYNCRCKAEPFIHGESEYAYQNLISPIDDSDYKWTDYDLTLHYYTSKGKGLYLSEIGHLRGVINYYFYTLGKYNDVINQVITAARAAPAGQFSHYVRNSYGFRPYLFVFGGGIVSGLFIGSIQHKGEMMIIKGNVDYYYDDVFTDPIDIREMYEDENAHPEELNGFERLLEVGGDFFPLKDHWQTTFYAEVNRGQETSIYFWPHLEDKS